MDTYNIAFIAMVLTVDCVNDTEISKLVEKYGLIELGKNITLKVLEPEKIKQPFRLPQTPTQSFIQDIFRYENRLRAVYTMMVNEIDEGQKIFQYLYDHDGPPHLRLKFDYHYLTSYYGLKEDDIVSIKDLLVSTRQLWLKICKKKKRRKTKSNKSLNI